MRPTLLTPLICALLPLSMGSMIFLAWLFLHWPIFEGLGLLTIGVGLILFFVGTGSLFSYHRWAKANEVPNHHRNGLIVLGLLLLNFPLAIAYTWAALTLYHVEVVNESASPVEGLVVSGIRSEARFGTIQPGESAGRFLAIRLSDSLKFQAVHAGKPVQGDVGMVWMGGEKVIIFRPDGSIDVEDKNSKD